MIDRDLVEDLLSDATHPDADYERVEASTLAALCRAWLAVDSGIYATLSRNDVDAMALPDSWSGQRVRIVKEAGEVAPCRRASPTCGTSPGRCA